MMRRTGGLARNSAGLGRREHHQRQERPEGTRMFALQLRTIGGGSTGSSCHVVVIKTKRAGPRQRHGPTRGTSAQLFRLPCLGPMHWSSAAFFGLLLMLIVATNLAHLATGAAQYERRPVFFDHFGQQKVRGFGQPLPRAELLISGPLAANNVNNNADRPRLIPLVAAESGYSENSSVNILCTVSQGHHETLQFEWFKDGQLLQSSGDTVAVQPFELGAQSNHHQLGQQPNQLMPQIEKHSDHSLLRIARVQSQHSGRYTCAAKSQFGQDSSSVNLMVNVKLQWIKEPPKEIVVSLNQELKVDCLAQGEPKPQMRWEKLDSATNSFAQQSSSASTNSNPQQASATMQLMYSMSSKRGNTIQFPSQSGGFIDGGTGGGKNQLVAKGDPNAYMKQPLGGSLLSQTGNLLVSSSRYLNIQRARESDTGFYECIASNSHDSDLRKLVHVQVRGLCRMEAPISNFGRATPIMIMSGLVFALVVFLANSILVFGQQNGEQSITNKKLANLELRDDNRLRSNYDEQFNNLKQDQTDQIKVQYVNVNGLPVLVQFTYVGPPKILPIATADSYPEGSSINLICTVSGGQRRGLALSWTVNGEELDESKLKYSNDKFTNVAINTDDADISILKIKNATSKNSGRYTCTARNPLGEDSTSVEIVINVEMKWSKFPKDLIEVGLNQELKLECDATGSPQPVVEWIKHVESADKRNNGSNSINKDKLLKINRVQHKDSGLYECIARNGVDDQLRKIIQIKVRGK